jgi:hypothetical protein
VRPEEHMVARHVDDRPVGKDPGKLVLDVAPFAICRTR